ncbi:histidine phosphatase family protein [Vagococcus zengguangii]|uniref:Histidine phosphatase family protein n=1 Tax=Vagococcus zengguangii TaxID=2571750 RepID=A0A4D7CU60_9ENTE|nr:histidine phosphatase family protein [Vagococcus zengguangii]QCI85917.1 histidine phosphatase family protein [Vagococcus zengguangii]TLG78309.1 histidine phosphatase family protein [Vagococcus zengguangii]
MKRLYLMRHAETLFNKLGKIQGACDSPLTENGKLQAQKAKEMIKEEGIVFDGLYCSTQERASDTLEIVTNSSHYQRIKGLKEWHFGDFEGESERLNPKITPPATSYGEYFVEYGGESFLEVQERMKCSLLEIMTNANQSVLVVSHGGAIYSFSQLWLSFEKVKTLSFGNCAILVFEFDEAKQEFSFVEVLNP